jgi:hypothetical protein
LNISESARLESDHGARIDMLDTEMLVSVLIRLLIFVDMILKGVCKYETDFEKSCIWRNDRRTYNVHHPCSLRNVQGCISHRCIGAGRHLAARRDCAGDGLRDFLGRPQGVENGD